MISIAEKVMIIIAEKVMVIIDSIVPFFPSLIPPNSTCMQDD